MFRKKLQWQLFPSYLLITILSLTAVAVFSSKYIRDFYLHNTHKALHSRAVLVGDQVSAHLARGDLAGIDALCKKLGKASKTRITVILGDGVVAGDTEEDPANMDNHIKRPEVVDARKNGVGQSVRFSNTLNQRMMYVAIPLKGEGRDSPGFVRTSVSVSSIDHAIGTIRNRIALLGFIVAVLAAAVSLYVSRRISGPVEAMKSMAERFAAGDFSSRIPVPDSEEIGGLAETMNRMAAQLDERIKTVVRQRNELEAVLTSMVEGVIAVDADEKVLSINRAASRMFSVQGHEICGKSIQEAVRNADLHEFISRTLEGGDALEEDVTLRVVERDIYLRVHGTALADGDGKNIGVLVVLNDITNLHKLENMRRDFVANVSHELKTPITSIRGFVETILGGAIENRDETVRFLAIIEKQSDRLNTIINDLLKLSRIERDEENRDIEFTESSIYELLCSAIDACRIASGEKNIEIELQCDLGLRARVNVSLLEQAMLNLLDNAVKYSPADTTVHVSAQVKSSCLTISVTDEGPGIAPEHHERLFERFYRVDRARSRSLGGTGLGLSIVKHVASSHGGYTDLKSAPGRGSTFSILIPYS